MSHGGEDGDGEGVGNDDLYGAAYEGITYKDGSFNTAADFDENREQWLDDDEPLSAWEMRNAEQVLETTNDTAELLKNPNIHRMLIEAYRWHNGLKQKGIEDRNEYPVIALGPEANLWMIEDSPFYIDTFDLKLKTGSEIKQFPEDPRGKDNELAENLWNNFVVRHFLADNAIRLYHRKDL